MHCFDALNRRDEVMKRINEWRSRVGVTGMLATNVALLLLGFGTASAIWSQQRHANRSMASARAVIDELNQVLPLPV
jgi:hypothetical protein